MTGFRHILFPVDFSARCHALRPFVKAAAYEFDASLTLMHVIPSPIGWPRDAAEEYPAVLDLEEMDKHTRHALDSFFDVDELHGIEVRRVVRHGDPGLAIADYVEEHGVDLVMMPTRGHGKFRSLLLGSVTAKVLHDVKCPVWTATHTDDPNLTDHLECKRIVCAIDLKERSGVILRHAASLAKHYSAPVRVIHALPVLDLYSEDTPEIQFEKMLARDARERIADLQHEIGTHLETCVHPGSVSKIVRAAALDYMADLVVIGRGKAETGLGRLRTNAYAIIRDAPCPVLSV